MGTEPAIFLVACIVSLVLTAMIREIAPRIGLTDNPDGRRKLHGRAIPLGGGVAVFLTWAIILGALWLVPSPRSDVSPDPTPDASVAATADAETTYQPYVPRDIREKLKDDCPNLPALLLAGLVIVVVGLIDDYGYLSGKQKLLGQIVAASILLADGLLIRQVEVFGWQLSMGWFAYPVTLFWLLGAVNSLNLLDGIDGLATMLGMILSCTIAAMSVVTGNFGVAIIAMIFAASLLGFMRYNFPPATIFLGDSGSMLIGLLVGALAILGSFKGAGTVLLAAPLAVWTIPIFDSLAAILRRKLTGQSIYATDRGHLHHRLLNLLGSNRKVLGWVAGCCAVISVATLVGLVNKNDNVTLLTCLAVVAIFIATGVFGRVELLLVGSRLRKMGRMLVAPIIWSKAEAWQTSIQLQGNQRWETLWRSFVESADQFQLLEIHLDVNMPTVHEAYHASWESSRRTNRDCCWRIDVPLLANAQPVGRIRITGVQQGPSTCLQIQELMELIEPFEARIHELAQTAAGGNQPVAETNPSGKPEPVPSGNAGS